MTSRQILTWVVTLVSCAPMCAGDAPVAWKQTGALAAPEANQAAAADERFVYAVNDGQIAKYDRATGERLAVSNGPAKHLNSGVLWQGRLYCAHSNYPRTPELSEIKVLEPETMRLTTFKDFGNFGGSLTWAVRHDSHWWCNFARYGDDNAQTFLVKFDDGWKEKGRWTYPSEVIKHLGRYSLSGGVWRDGSLLVTGHDDPILFRLRLPRSGTVLEYLDKQRAPFTGQGIAHDPKTGGLVGIQRGKRQVVFASSDAPKVFRAGAATSNITPPLGSPIVGGFAPFPSTHVHDELHARCLVLDDGNTKLVIVVCDLLGIDRLVSDEARALIHKDLDIPPDNVLISATHTHSAASALGKDARIISHTMDEYQRFVSRRIVDGVKRAANLLRPARIGWGAAEAPEHVFNRRWHLKPGTMPPNPFGEIDKVKMNPPAGSPNLVEPAGPTDPAIPFIALREPDGKPIAVFSTYSLHYVGGVGPGHISADYFGMYCDALSRLVKADAQTPAFVALMANGTSGDINNINFREPRGKQPPYAQMKFVADDVARTVHQALDKVAYRDHVQLAARYREPTIATRRPDDKLVAWAKKTLAERPKVAGKTDLSLVYAERTLRMDEHPEQLKVPLQAFRIGDLAIGTMPCEIFCEIGLDFKKRSPVRPAWLVSIAHGYYGYLPTPKHHELGGYETWLGTNRLEVRASDKMLNTLLDMVGELSR